MNRENKKGMVSLGSLSGGSGKPAIDKHDGYIGKAKNRGQTPNDPHPIGVSVRLIPKVAEPKPEEILPEFPMREQEYYSNSLCQWKYKLR